MKNFCIHCGAEMQLKETWGFNAKTGKRNEGFICTNTSCFVGCANNGGHKYKGWFNPKCVRCGSYVLSQE